MPRKAPDFCSEVRDQIQKWNSHWTTNIKEYHEMTSFVMGTQWKDDEADMIKTYRKVPLQFNKLAPLINHLLGEQRQNTPALEVIPDESTTPEVAEVREALIKDISFASDSKVVYQNAFQQSAIGGFSVMMVVTEYEDAYSFNQDIRIKGMNDPTRAYFDLGAQTPCKTDGMFSGFRTRVSRKRFASEWGKRIEGNIKSHTTEDANTTFSDDDSITVIDHYKRIGERLNIYQLSNERVIDEDELEELVVDIDGDEMIIDNGQLVTIVQKRETTRYKIKHYKMAGDYILDETDFPSEQLPVIYIDQNSYWEKSGKQVTRPFVKDAKDAQRFINYLGTQIAYLIKVSRYDQFMASKANVKSQDTQAIWRDPATVQGALIYDVDTIGNTKPEQLRPAELSQSLMQQYQRALADIQTSTGLYDAKLGEQGNEISGAAIDARTKQGSYSTYVIFDSLNRAICVAGQIINEMIPKVYDTKRSMALQLPSTGMQNVTINNPVDEYGAMIENDMRKGTYKVRLQAGPSFEGQKQLAFESLETVLKANPQLFNIIADLYAENLPLPNNLELRNRLRTLVPPQIIEAGKTGQPLPPQQEQPNPELMMAMEKLQQEQQKIEIKKQELLLKQQQMGIDVSIELQKLEEQRISAAAKLEETRLRYIAETHRTQTDENIKHADNLMKLITTHMNGENRHDNSSSR